MAGSRKDETSLHEQFVGVRMHGEWFDPSAQLLEFIDKNVEDAQNFKEMLIRKNKGLLQSLAD